MLRLFYTVMSATEQSSPCKSVLSQTWTNEQDQNRKRILLLGILAVATTSNDIPMLEEWIPKSKTILGQEAIEELILQTLLFAGFPKSIEALKIVRKYFPISSSLKHVDDYKIRGQQTSRIIYGDHHVRLLEVMDDLHPDLTRWMIEDGYGRVLSRPGLNIQDREIGVIASLMASGMLNQFGAHIRGALFTGISSDDIVWFTKLFKCIIASDMQVEYESMIEKILASHADSAIRRVGKQ